ncbi:HAD family phosphatase [Flavobacterium paronense]|uniref:HAD family hydrolase n=1 Tax=Flavobacterium paronense TaxID=1392775 RepID=A0ABV5GHG7_9FLAO|nr:HAD family phosphatase [Flavobacterium paronense]MDN3676457.1 HAD family phosphatase [Flavobacterium paronense]
MKIKNIVFDFGGVLVDWNPRHLYKSHFQDTAEMESFLKNICTEEWNIEQDRGRSLSDATIELQKKFPEHSASIALFYDKWEVMLKGEIPGTVALLHQLKKTYTLYGLTNWSSETIGIAYKRFSFFKEFEGIIVSGTEKLIKPDKRIYQLLLDRYSIKAEESIFIDDNIHNVKAALELGFYAIHFENPEQLEAELSEIITM